jgi:DNA-directed RNA polymerase subunit RPC12/RpoP
MSERTPETTYESSEVRCPYCLELQSDSWELGDGGEDCDTMECGHCEKEFIWSRSFSVTYKGTPTNQPPTK